MTLEEVHKMEGPFESKGLKVNLMKSIPIVSVGSTKDVLSKIKFGPYEVCSWTVKANSVLCVQCGEQIHGRCSGIKRVMEKVLKNFTCRKCEENIGEAVEHEEKLCVEVETVREFTYLGEG